MSERDIDAEFDAIVARWDDDGSTTAAAPVPRGSPVLPESPRSAPPRTVHDITSAYAALSAPDSDSPSADDAVPRSAEVGDGDWRRGPAVEDDDHFEPGPVELPPGEDIGYWGAVVGLLGGPLVLLWVVIGKPFYAGWWTAGAITAFLGGFALLVMRQPADRDPFDGDDGARV